MCSRCEWYLWAASSVQRMCCGNGRDMLYSPLPPGQPSQPRLTSHRASGSDMPCPSRASGVEAGAVRCEMWSGCRSLWGHECGDEGVILLNNNHGETRKRNHPWTKGGGRNVIAGTWPAHSKCVEHQVPAMALAYSRPRLVVPSPRACEPSGSAPQAPRTARALIGPGPSSALSRPLRICSALWPRERESDY